MTHIRMLNGLSVARNKADFCDKYIDKKRRPLKLRKMTRANLVIHFKGLQQH